MNKETLAALDASIKHWEENVALPMAETSVAAEKCALCELFFQRGMDDTCQGCPIFEASGSTYCEDTPYHEAAEWRYLWRHDPRANNATREKRFREAALAELSFLKAIRPIGL